MLVEKMLNKVKKSLMDVKSILLGRKRNNIQYKTEKTIVRDEIPLIDEGTFEVEFSEIDENGIVDPEKEPNKNIVYKQPVKEARELDKQGLSPLGEDEENEEIEDEEFPEDDGEQEGYAFFDCPDLGCTISVSGVRDGNIHVLCSDSIGSNHNIKISDVFFESGQPRVYGIVIRKEFRDSSNKVAHKLLGYIDFDNYIGFSASSTIAIEDIIKENVQEIKNGTNNLPEEVTSQVA